MSSPKVEPKTVFVIGPIGEKGSEIREAADTLKNEIILPALEEALGEGKFILERADDIGQPGRISLQILEKLVASDIAVVDLAGLNSNVMYELGVRQAQLKPYILLRPSGQNLPFDIADIRAIDYDFSLPGGKKAIKLLAEMVRHADKSVTATDSLLFRPTSSEQAASVEPWQQRIQVQILDQLSALREGQEAVFYGVQHLVNQEDRQRADMAEYRQQELGFRFFESMAGSNPQGMLELLQQFAVPSQGGNGSASQNASTSSSRSQRRAADRKKPKP